MLISDSKKNPDGDGSLPNLMFQDGSPQTTMADMMEGLQHAHLHQSIIGGTHLAWFAHGQKSSVSTPLILSLAESFSIPYCTVEKFTFCLCLLSVLTVSI